MRKRASLFAFSLILMLVFLGSIAACSKTSPSVEPVGPVTTMPPEMVLKITDLKGDSWMLTESEPVSEHGAEYAYQVAFSRETSQSPAVGKEMVSCKAALYYHEGEAHEGFLAAIKSDVPTTGLKFGDEAFLDTRPVINGKALIFREDNVVVWIWMNYDGDIESLAKIVEERIAQSH